MPLAVFDVDGTLTDSNAVDAACFIEAFRGEFGLDVVSADWSAFPHFTDRGLTRDLLRLAWSRDPQESEIARHRDSFLRHLRERVSTIAEVRGGRAFVSELRRRGWGVTLATGAWRESALMKLSAAGFDDDLLIACCDDLVAREEIVRASIALAGDRSEPVVLFGDGPWDLRCAANLNLPIVMIAAGMRAEKLRAAGAVAVVKDYADQAAVFAAIDAACGVVR